MKKLLILLLFTIGFAYSAAAQVVVVEKKVVRPVPPRPVVVHKAVPPHPVVVTKVKKHKHRHPKHVKRTVVVPAPPAPVVVIKR